MRNVASARIMRLDLKSCKQNLDLLIPSRPMPRFVEPELATGAQAFGYNARGLAFSRGAAITNFSTG
jgi:hypothetical protein